MNVRDASYINDPRNNYKIRTFNEYKKTDVFNSLQKTITESRLEEACHWAAELVASGHAGAIFEKLLIYNSKNINIKNPKLPTFLVEKYTYFIKVMSYNYFKFSPIYIRNNQQVRNLITEVVATLALSRKGPIFKFVKINDSDFRYDKLKSRFIADNSNYIIPFYKNSDPLEIRVIMNEFAFNLTKKNLNGVIYWLSWLLEWEKRLLKANKQVLFAPRVFQMVDQKFCRDMIWLLWEIVTKIPADYNKTTEINQLFKLYRLNFTKGKRNSRLPYLMHSIILVTENVNFSIPVKSDVNMIANVVKNTNVLYYEILKSYQSFIKMKSHMTQTDYNQNVNITNKNNNNPMVNKILAQGFPDKPKKEPKKKKPKKGDLNPASENKLKMVEELYNTIL